MRHFFLLLILTIPLQGRSQTTTDQYPKPHIPSLRVVKNKGDRDTLFLKSRFNPIDSYINFNFDYDQLDIDTVPYPSGNGKYFVRFTGFIYENDSFISSGLPVYVSSLEERFTMEVDDGELSYIQERIDSPQGEYYTIYRNETVYGRKVYAHFDEDHLFTLSVQYPETQQFYLDDRDSLIHYRATPGKEINLDDLIVKLDSSGNVSSFYHANRVRDLLSPDKENGVITLTYHTNGFIHERYRTDEQGNKIGRYTKYSTQEFITETGSFVVDEGKSKKNGVWNYFDENGIPIRVELYKNGKLISTQIIRTKGITKRL